MPIISDLIPGFTIHHGSDLDPTVDSWISNSFGGRQKLTMRISWISSDGCYWSKGRMFTREDIKAIMSWTFWSRLTMLKLKRVYTWSLIDKGLVRSLDIFLTISKECKLTRIELEQKTDELKIRLIQDQLTVALRIFILTWIFYTNCYSLLMHW